MSSDTKKQTIDGYVLDYWEDEYGNRYVYDEESIDGNIVTQMASTESDAERYKLTAHFKKAEVHIELNQNWEDAIELPIFNTKFDSRYDVIQALPTPVRPGYTFKGWTRKLATPYEVVPEAAYVKNTDIVRATPTTADSDEVLYAHWNHVPYTLTMEAGEEVGLSGLVQTGTYSSTNRYTRTKEVRYERPIGERGERDEVIEDLEEPVLAGYEFAGYQYVLNGLEEDADENTDYWQTSNGSIKAIWEPIEYKVGYDKGADDAEGTMADIDIIYDEPASLTPIDEAAPLDQTFKRKGYSFDYWENTNFSEDLKNINAHIAKAAIPKVLPSLFNFC